MNTDKYCRTCLYWRQVLAFMQRKYGVCTKIGDDTGEDFSCAGWVEKPSPGSPEAIERGCTCPVLDNNHGRGRGDGQFWVRQDCPLHGAWVGRGEGER